MKVLYVSTSFSTITHTFIAREITSLRRRGVEVLLLSLRTPPHHLVAPEPECDMEGERVLHPIGSFRILGAFLKWTTRHPLRMGRAIKAALGDSRDGLKTKIKLLYQLMCAASVAEWVLTEGFDHIHAHFASPPTSLAMFLHCLTGIPFSFTGHAADIYREGTALKSKLSLAAGTVCISRFNLEFFRTILPDLGPTRIVHCGINLSDFPIQERPEPGSAVRILAVGRLVPKKGFGDLLLALAELDRRGIEWEAAIAGDGPLLEDLDRQSSQLGLNERLHLLGAVPQSEIKSRIRSTHLFVLPSVPCTDGDVDGIPVALMEAMALGCPVISTEVSGIPELVINRETGLLVQPGNPMALADAIAEFVEDPELVTKLAKKGRKMIEDQFDINKSGAELETFFASIAGTTRA